MSAVRTRAIGAALDRIDAVLEAAPSGRGYPIFIP